METENEYQKAIDEVTNTIDSNKYSKEEIKVFKTIRARFKEMKKLDEDYKKLRKKDAK